jgi:tetratricopeptide (TPR) repeat protein
MVEGRLDPALAELDRAVALEPRYGAAWCNRAVALERMTRFDDAVASLDRALEIDPGAAALWHNKGNLLLKAGKREDALRCFKREVKIDHRRWFDLPPEIRSAVDQLA